MKKQKGDDKMEHKDIWLVLGLTVILAVAVSLSTVSLTGDAVWPSLTKKPVTVTYKTCELGPNGGPWSMEVGDSVRYNPYNMFAEDNLKFIAGSPRGPNDYDITISAIGSSNGGTAKIDVNGISNVVIATTSINNNLKTINGLTFKISDVVHAVGPNQRSSLTLYIFDNCPVLTCTR